MPGWGCETFCKVKPDGTHHGTRRVLRKPFDEIRTPISVSARWLKGDG